MTMYSSPPSDPHHPRHSKSEEDKAEASKVKAHIAKILQKQEIELDKETEEIIGYLAREGGILKGVGKIIDKDTIVSLELQLLGTTQRDAVKQRIIEYLAALSGFGPLGGKGEGSTVADVVIDSFR